MGHIGGLQIQLLVCVVEMSFHFTQWFSIKLYAPIFLGFLDTICANYSYFGTPIIAYTVIG